MKERSNASRDRPVARRPCFGYARARTAIPEAFPPIIRRSPSSVKLRIADRRVLPPSSRSASVSLVFPPVHINRAEIGCPIDRPEAVEPRFPIGREGLVQSARCELDERIERAFRLAIERADVTVA